MYISRRYIRKILRVSRRCHLLIYQILIYSHFLPVAALRILLLLFTQQGNLLIIKLFLISVLLPTSAQSLFLLWLWGIRIDSTDLRRVYAYNWESLSSKVGYLSFIHADRPSTVIDRILDWSQLAVMCSLYVTVVLSAASVFDWTVIMKLFHGGPRLLLIVDTHIPPSTCNLCLLFFVNRIYLLILVKLLQNIILHLL